MKTTANNYNYHETNRMFIEDERVGSSCVRLYKFGIVRKRKKEEKKQKFEKLVLGAMELARHAKDRISDRMSQQNKHALHKILGSHLFQSRALTQKIQIINFFKGVNLV